MNQKLSTYLQIIIPIIILTYLIVSNEYTNRSSRFLIILSLITIGIGVYKLFVKKKN